MMLYVGRTLHLIADDLTGALDSAAPFATPNTPVQVPLKTAMPEGSISLSSESRDLPLSEALARVGSAWARLGRSVVQDDLVFKKVDSVLRGHPLEETLHLMRLGGFAHCVFAPAFPKMGRVTRRGQHLVKSPDGSWAPTPHSDLCAAFAKLGVRAGCGNGDAETVTVVDAETQDDLAAAVAQWGHRHSVLWAGSRGLAEALAPLSPPLPRPRVALFVFGTAHPSSRAQADELARVTIPFPTHGRVGLTSTQSLLLDPVPQAQDATVTARAIADSISRLDGSMAERTLFVTGGNTLAQVLAASRADGLNCTGEIASGLPFSIVLGGSLNQVGIVTKSGGFGDADLLLSLAVHT
ncbi:MAG: hypothetical protein JJU24_15390 [Natronohydrobacter sp.]|nr:hypothetical protein [Natronohydrobacter sp.]